MSLRMIIQARDNVVSPRRPVRRQGCGRRARRVSGTLILDCDGLSKIVFKDRMAMARLAQARLDGLRVVASAATLVEARDPGMDQARFDWAASRLVIEPVTEALARAASKLLASRRCHGHQHAMDAMVAATALAAPSREFCSPPTPRISACCAGRACVSSRPERAAARSAA